jgi:hypothetical protein
MVANFYNEVGENGGHDEARGDRFSEYRRNQRNRESRESARVRNGVDQHRISFAPIRVIRG